MAPADVWNTIPVFETRHWLQVTGPLFLISVSQTLLTSTDTLMLGSMVEKAIQRAIDALVRLDADVARQVIADDAHINARRYRLEEDAVRLIATQRPLARSLLMPMRLP